MKGIVNRSVALALACIVALSVLVVPSFATDYQSTYNFWNWAYDNSWFLGKAIIGFSAGNVCQVSEDSLHHATTHSGGGGSVDGQRVYNCVCDFCGESFTAVATDLQNSYYDANNNNYSVNSSGVVTSTNLSFAIRSSYDNITYSYEYPIVSTLFPDLGGSFAGVNYHNQTGGYRSLRYIFYFMYTPSVDGCLYMRSNSCGYNQVISKFEKYSGTTQPYAAVDDSFVSLDLFDGKYDGYTYYSVLNAGVTYRICAELSPLLNYDKAYYNEYRIQPWECLFVPDVPDVNNRPSTFFPSFSYIDDSGGVVVSDNQIIDETNLTYYNPVTNTTTNIQNWSYDYSDRSYTVLTDSNNTTTITYGDEYITINEGDNITYNIYYYTEPDSSGDGSGGSGDSSDDGDGIGGGLGELLGSLLGGLIDLITGLISGLIDSLINLVEMTIEKLGQVVNLFGEFGDALKVLWSWLPDEVVTILAAGVSVVVFASVIKLFV